MQKISLNKIPYTQMTNVKTKEKFSKYISISDILNLNDIRIFHEKLEPHTKASHSHAHTHQEEIFIILSGNPTLYLNQKPIELEANDVIFFEPNINEYHFIMNNTEKEVIYLIISKNYKDDTVHYNKENSL